MKERDIAEVVDEIERLRAKYNDANRRLEALETFVHAIAWGPPHIIQPLQYVNGLVDKAQKLCPKEGDKEAPSNVVQFDRR